MKRLLAASLGFCLAMTFSSAASAGTLVLNTGYNYSTNSALPFGAQDPTWIKIASYEPPATTVSVSPAWVVNQVGWATLPGAQWLSPRVSSATSAGTSPSRPAYSIFRKCFCLLDGFLNAQLSINVRGDDNIQVWLNTALNTLIPPLDGRHVVGQLPRSYPSLQFPANSQYFRVGRNCIYVLVEDNYAPPGAIGFILSGSVSAAGLMPNPATGINGNFGSCGCPSEPNSADVNGGTPTASNEADVVRAIVRIAETRRLARLAAMTVAVGGGGGRGRR